MFLSSLLDDSSYKHVRHCVFQYAAVVHTFLSFMQYDGVDAIGEESVTAEFLKMFQHSVALPHELHLSRRCVAMITRSLNTKFKDGW